MSDKSLGQLLESAASLTTAFGVAYRMCDAVILLNASGKPARANEHIERVAFCPGARFVAVAGEMICASCWTPKKGNK